VWNCSAFWEVRLFSATGNQMLTFGCRWYCEPFLVTAGLLVLCKIPHLKYCAWSKGLVLIVKLKLLLYNALQVTLRGCYTWRCRRMAVQLFQQRPTKLFVCGSVSLLIHARKIHSLRPRQNLIVV